MHDKLESLKLDFNLFTEAAERNLGEGHSSKILLTFNDVEDLRIDLLETES